MKSQHLVTGLAWAATVVIAYVAGSSGSPSAPAPTVPPPAPEQNLGGEKAPLVRKLESDGPGHRENVDVPAAIARARYEMAGGMGGMMNMRGMMRAVAPLLELDDAQLQEALAEIERTVKEPQQQMMFYALLLGQWAEKDGKAAFDFAREKFKGNPMFEMSVTASILGPWARSNPDAAWRWYEKEGKSAGNGRMVLHTLFAGLAAGDLDSALQRLETVEESERPMAVNGIAMSGMDERRRARLLDRAASLPEITRDSLRQSVISQWAMMDADGALKWLGGLPEAEQKPLREQVGNSLMMMNPKRGAELLLQSATDDEKPRIYDRAVSMWANQDPKAAGQWLAAQPQGPELDNARMTFATVVSQRDPAAAMDWAKSVTKNQSREMSVGIVYQNWKRRDTAAANAALDGSGLAAEAIQRIRETKATDTGVPGALQATPAPER